MAGSGEMGLPLVCLLALLVAASEAVRMPRRHPTVWSAWSHWTGCSRSCGVGVRRRSRSCLVWAGHTYAKTTLTYCSGNNTGYEVCGKQDCPDDADFRASQCSMHNHRHYLFGVAYTWIPTTGKNPCDLNCRAEGYRIQYNFGRVADGTLCYPDEKAVCVGGTCKDMGCDGEIASGMVADKCGVCRREKGTCRLVKGSAFPRATKLPEFLGYYQIVEIPQGSTKILIRNRPGNSLVVLNSRGAVELDGARVTDTTVRLRGLGSKLHYSRRATGETVRVPGPTDDVLNVMVRYKGANKTVSYEYYTTNPQLSTRHETLPSTTSGPTPRLSTAEGTSQRKGRALSGQALEGNYVVKDDQNKIIKTIKNKSKRKTVKPAKKDKRIKNKSNKKLKSRKRGKSPKPAFCKPCRRPRDRKKQFCSSSFVSHVRVTDYLHTENETRYDIRVLKTYRNSIPLVSREFLWVPYKCRCPKLKIGREYVIMGRADNYMERQLRLTVDYTSYVRKHSEKMDKKLRYLRDKKKCRRVKKKT